MISAQEDAALRGLDAYGYYPNACGVPQSSAFAVDASQGRYEMDYMPSVPNYVPMTSAKDEHDTGMYGERWQNCRPFQGFSESANHYPGMNSTTTASMNIRTTF